MINTDRPREGDFFETIEGLIFAVIGFHHLQRRVRSVLRFLPDISGDRLLGKQKYKKVQDYKKSIEILKRCYPEYLNSEQDLGERIITSVPIEAVKHFYRPVEKLREIMVCPFSDADETIKGLVQSLILESKIPVSKLGVTGSALVNLRSSSSDIDLIAYGHKTCQLLYETLGKLYQSSEEHFCEYSTEFLKRQWEMGANLSHFDLKDFLHVEKRKRYKGMFKGKNFYIRFVRDWDEISPEMLEAPFYTLGMVQVKALVTNDDDGFFTPCHYGIKVKKMKILSLPSFRERLIQDGTSLKEIVSYWGNYCGIKKGETITVKGVLERTKSSTGEKYNRLVLAPDRGDFIRINRGII